MTPGHFSNWYDVYTGQFESVYAPLEREKKAHLGVSTCRVGQS